MKYSTIVNIPNERTSITYPFVSWDGAFSAAELDRIAAQCSVADTEPAATLGAVDTDVRISKIRFHLRTQETAWIFDRLNLVITNLNNQFYGYELNGYDSFQYTEYYGPEHGKYDWHMDLCLGTPPSNMVESRKLSLSLLLNEPGVDYKGGDFQINVCT